MLQLQINTSGSWRTLMRFAEAECINVMLQTQRLFAFDYTAAKQRHSLRIATADGHAKALHYFDCRAPATEYAWRAPK